MTKVHVAFGFAALTAVAALAAAGEGRSSTDASANLFASVNRAGHVSLRDAAGRRVTSIPAGAYAVVVRDGSKHQNFHLVGPKPSVGKRTGVKFVGTVPWTLTLSAGTYRYYSDKTPAGLKTFRVQE